jgi:alpha-D-ribose 1-methylphosphonate 5-triphosphate synthase subunit PhnG
VSRATVRLDSGEIGHGQLLGNDREKARLAAVFDALRQRPEHRQAVLSLVDAVESRIEAEDRKQAEQAAATRVDFFTMVRGDN